MLEALFGVVGQIPSKPVTAQPLARARCGPLRSHRLSDMGPGKDGTHEDHVKAGVCSGLVQDACDEGSSLTCGDRSPGALLGEG